VPISNSFAGRLLPILRQLADGYGTPFHIYDAEGIVDTHRKMVAAFDGADFKQYFAVKALPNPNILRLLAEEGAGLDCSSPTELRLARSVGARGEDIIFTANNTSSAEYEEAIRSRALVTFDDAEMADRLSALPDLVSFRVVPDGVVPRSVQMGDAVGSKFGVAVKDAAGAYELCRTRGVRRFGIHGMTIANELDTASAVAAARAVMLAAKWISCRTGVTFEYVNIGGGLGIPYRPDDRPIDVELFARGVIRSRDEIFAGATPRIVAEFGRYVTGPHGVLVSRVTSRSRKGVDVIALDASMSALMRPAMYPSAYHHVTAPFRGGTAQRFDVVGPLCENMDKFGTDRLLPPVQVGDLVMIHDTGAHGHAMGFTYNGRLRPAELLLGLDGRVLEIRRPESFDDYIGTVVDPPVPLALSTRHGIAPRAGELTRADG